MLIKIVNYQFVLYLNIFLIFLFERELCYVFVICVYFVLVICNYLFVNIISQDDVDVNFLIVQSDKYYIFFY